MTIDLTALGWDAVRAQATRPGRRPGRVAWVDRGICLVLGRSGPVRASLSGAVLAAAARDPGALPCPGDWVLLGTWPDGPVTVEATLPRRTALPDPAGSGRALAANLDAAALVVPAHPAPDLTRVRRLLRFVVSCGVAPLIVLSKADLAVDAAALAHRVALVAPGVAVLPVSAARGTGLDRLRPEVGPGRTLGLLGPAGAGRSSLLDALAGARVMPTTVRRIGGGRYAPYPTLVPVPGGGVVLDTGREAVAAGLSCGNAPTRDSVVPRG